MQSYYNNYCVKCEENKNLRLIKRFATVAIWQWTEDYHIDQNLQGKKNSEVKFGSLEKDRLWGYHEIEN